jgi:hypothetical protein
MSRNYKKEYDNYHASEDQRKKRSSRNKARRKMTKSVGKSKLRGKDVDHRDGNPLNNSRGNLRVSCKSKNRSRK